MSLFLDVDLELGTFESGKVSEEVEEGAEGSSLVFPFPADLPRSIRAWLKPLGLSKFSLTSIQRAIHVNCDAMQL